MAEVHSFIQQALSGRRLSLEESRQIERHANHLIDLARTSFEGQDVAYITRVVTQATVKCLITSLGTYEKDQSFNEDTFHEWVRVFAYELLTEMACRNPWGTTEDLKAAVNTYAYGK